MAPDKPYRGLLLFHDLGSGKTRTAITVSEQYRASPKFRDPILVLLPASLKSTWIDELRKWGNDDIREPPNLSPNERQTYMIRFNRIIDKSYQFVTYNASNTVQILNQLGDWNIDL